MVIRPFFWGILFFSLIGCASPGGITLLGTAAGSVVGGGIGLLPDAGPRGKGRAQNVFAGSTIGALIGAGIGFFLEQYSEKKSQNLPENIPDPISNATRSLPDDPTRPILVPPRVDGHFVDDQIRGNTFIPGHFEYQIKEPAKWTK